MRHAFPRLALLAGSLLLGSPAAANDGGADPRNADAFNNLGYSHRKLGKRDKALISYAEALRRDPKHLGALESQGKLFLELGDVPRAEANLDHLGRLCGRCETYRDLAETILAHKAKPRT